MSGLLQFFSLLFGRFAVGSFFMATWPVMPKAILFGGRVSSRDYPIFFFFLVLSIRLLPLPFAEGVGEALAISD
jgi:hypothetical protein